jgi:hypothetical protein
VLIMQSQCAGGCRLCWQAAMGALQPKHCAGMQMQVLLNTSCADMCPLRAVGPMLCWTVVTVGLQDTGCAHDGMSPGYPAKSMLYWHADEPAPPGDKLCWHASAASACTRSRTVCVLHCV